jgi:hypothetical protein
MIKQILYKWFNIEEPPCASCEALRDQLVHERHEKNLLLQKVFELSSPKEEGPFIHKEPEELKPITPRTMPWRVRQQMLEAEDRKKAETLRKRTEEIENLEKEVGVTNAS